LYILETNTVVINTGRNNSPW